MEATERPAAQKANRSAEPTVASSCHPAAAKLVLQGMEVNAQHTLSKFARLLTSDNVILSSLSPLNPASQLNESMGLVAVADAWGSRRAYEFWEEFK